MSVRNAVVAYYQKKYNTFLDIVLQRLRYYAKKCRADFLEFTLEENSTNPVIDKFIHIGESLPSYNRFLIMDVDILVRKDSPNLFSIVPANKLAMYNEACEFHIRTFTGNPETDKWEGMIGEAINIRYSDMNDIRTKCKVQWTDIPVNYDWDNPFIYFNSGVILYNKQSLELHQLSEESKKLLRQHARRCGEQSLLNYRIRQTNYFKKMYHLPICFNQMPHNRHYDYLKTTYFSHYAGMPMDKRTEEMLRDEAIWKSWGL